MDLQLRHDTIGGFAVLSLAGELDLATLPQLRNALVQLVADRPDSVVAVDLDGVSSLDDTGIGILLGAAGRAREAGGDLVVVCSDGRLLERFEVMRLPRAIDVVGSVHDITSARG